MSTADRAASGRGDDDSEAALDIEQVIGLAPRRTFSSIRPPGTSPEDILAQMAIRRHGAGDFGLLGFL